MTAALHSIALSMILSALMRIELRVVPDRDIAIVLALSGQALLSVILLLIGVGGLIHALAGRAAKDSSPTVRIVPDE